MNKNITTIQNPKRDYSAPMMHVVQLAPGTLFRAPLSSSTMNVYKEEVEDFDPAKQQEELKDIWGTQW